MKPSVLASLEKLLQEGQLAISSIGISARSELESWGNRSGCLQVVGKGRGAVLKVVNRAILQNHLQQIVPMESTPEASSRVKNLARFRDTKIGESRQDRQYCLIKAIGPDIRSNKQDSILELSSWTNAMGCLALELSETTPAWQSSHSALLVENQCLFDHTSWLNEGWQGILLYYAGTLSQWMIDWLSRSTFSEIELFPDYDGIGLKNYSRLKCRVPSVQWHWRRDWESALERFGNATLWAKVEQSKIVDELWIQWEATGWPDPQFHSLLQAMRTQGKMLEQEWVLAESQRSNNDNRTQA